MMMIKSDDGNGKYDVEDDINYDGVGCWCWDAHGGRSMQG